MFTYLEAVIEQEDSHGFSFTADGVTQLERISFRHVNTMRR